MPHGLPHIADTPPLQEPSPTPSTSTPSRPVVSPAERDYLVRQGRSIMLHGGTEQDVANFARLHIGRPPEERRTSVVEGITSVGGNPNNDDSLVLKGLGLTLKAVQGATFGFGDEAIGSIIGTLNPNQTRAEGVEMVRGQLEDVSRRDPILGFLSEAVGGLLTGATVARGVGLGRGIGSQIVAGVSGGATAGAGYTEGDISDRTRGALFGASFGGVLGGAVGAVAPLAGRVLKEPTRKALEFFDRLPVVGRAALQRRLPGLGTSKDAARRQIMEVLDAEGLSTEDLREAAVAFIRQGVRPTLADIGGEGTLALLSKTLQHRTAPKQKLAEFILERQASQGQRLSGNLFRRLFRSDQFGLENAYDAVDELARVRANAAAPLYDAAHQELVPVSPRMRTLITKNPKFRAAWEEGRRIAQSLDLIEAGEGALEVPQLPAGSLREAAEQQLLDMGASPEAVESALQQLPDEFPSHLPVRGLDYMKQGLDRVKERLLRRGGMDAKEFRAISGALEEILSEVDEAIPSYAEARRVWGGFSQAMDAVELGQDFLKKPPPLVQRELQALQGKADGLGDFYRLGAMQSLHETITGSLSRAETSDVARRVFGGRIFQDASGQDAQRIRALFDSDDVADDFMRRVVAETRLSRTAQAVGSDAPSPSRAFESPEDIGEGAIPSVRMNAVLTALGAAREASIFGSKRFLARVADDVAGFFSLGMDSPRELGLFLDSLDDFQMRQSAADAFGKAFKGGISGALGAEVGDFFGN